MWGTPWTPVKTHVLTIILSFLQIRIHAIHTCLMSLHGETMPSVASICYKTEASDPEVADLFCDRESHRDVTQHARVPHEDAQT